MLTKEQKVKAIKAKMLKIRFGRVEYTSLSQNEVRAVYATTGLSYKLVVSGNSSATYYHLENNLI